MSNTWNKHAWKLLGLTLVLAVSYPPVVRADEIVGGCASGSCPISFGAPCSSGNCQHFHCPHTKFCVEGPPCILVCKGCAKPVINPCTQPYWGYFQTCWAPWPGGPDWSHCPVQPPASLVFPPPGAQVPGATLPNGAPMLREGGLPYPRMIERP